MGDLGVNSVPVGRGSPSLPTAGNEHELVVRTKRTADGELKIAFWFLYGPTTIVEDNQWQFELTGLAPMRVTSIRRLVVPATAYDVSLDHYHSGTGIIVPADATVATSKMLISFQFGASGLAGARVPFVWDVGDWIAAGNWIEAFDN